jgi:hypothetical protein
MCPTGAASPIARRVNASPMIGAGIADGVVGFAGNAGGGAGATCTACSGSHGSQPPVARAASSEVGGGAGGGATTNGFGRCNPTMSTEAAVPLTNQPTHVGRRGRLNDSMASAARRGAGESMAIARGSFGL